MFLFPASSRKSPEQRLWNAVTCGDVAGVSQAITDGAHPERCTGERPILIQAVRRLAESPTNAASILKFLLAAGASVDARDEHGCSALSYTLVRHRLSAGFFSSKLQPHDLTLPHPTPRSGSTGVGIFSGIPDFLPLDDAGHWQLECAWSTLSLLLDAGASVRVPLGYCRLERVEPVGWARESATPALALYAALTEAGTRLDPGGANWRRVEQIGNGMTPEEFQHLHRFGVAPLYWTAIHGKTSTVEAWMQRGVGVELPPQCAARAIHPKGRTVEELIRSPTGPAAREALAIIHEGQLRRDLTAGDSPRARKRRI